MTETNPTPMVLSGRRGPALEIVLNQPERLNALTPAMRAEIARLLDAAAADSDVRVVVLRGAGRAFCSGYDLTAEDEDWQNWSASDWRRALTDDLVNFFLHFWECPRPVVVVAHGHAVGAASEFITLCDFVIASENAIFGQPEIRFGSTPEVLGLPFRVGMAAARDILLTGRQVTAAEALTMGLVTRVVPADELNTAVDQLVADLAAIDPAVMELNKASINRAYELMGLKRVLEYHVEIGSVLNATNSQDALTFYEIERRDGLKAALRWREGRFTSTEEGVRSA